MRDWRASRERPALLLTLHSDGQEIHYAVAEADNPIAIESLRGLAERYVSSGVCSRAEVTGMELDTALFAICDPRLKKPQMVVSHALARAEGRTDKSFEEFFHG